VLVHKNADATAATAAMPARVTESLGLLLLEVVVDMVVASRCRPGDKVRTLDTNTLVRRSIPDPGALSCDFGVTRCPGAACPGSVLAKGRRLPHRRPMLHSPIDFVTNFGDAALLLPMAVMLAAVLWQQQSAVAALAWVRALAVCLGAITALKLTGTTCGQAWLGAGAFSPSGHAALSATVYAAMAIIVARHGAPAWRLPATAGAALTIAAVAGTRVLLHAHSPAEVVTGLAVGGGAAAIFARAYWPLPGGSFRPRRAAVAAALLLVILHGGRLHAEEVIRSIAGELRQETGVCR
jgi:membrane-associated phospholipid phosphatase